ncbi:MAG: ribokinase, partial [Bacilli bacterium]|nr:ribokinase [Bacilli bacterium]
MNKKIIVVGSISIDHTVYTKEMPKPGITTNAESFYKNIGGKGANQAVQAHLLHSQVFFFGAVGNDVEGQFINSFLLEKGLSFKLKESKEQTGTAFITLNMNNGENQILIVPGANYDIYPSDIDSIDKELDDADILLTQLEGRIDTVDYLIRKAKEKGLITVLNTAPYHELDTSLYPYIDYFVPNEHELDGYVEGKCNGTYEDKARYMVNQGIKNVIVTLGDKGSLLVNKDEVIKVEPHKVDAVDTTAAGDS